MDTYWSDHCRHTTFGTHIDAVDIQDPEVRKAYEAYLAGREEVYGPEKAARRPQTLMDVGTLGAKVLKKRGELPNLDESEEINACSIHIPVDVDGQEQDWLLMFKNETHNHPTEIEPFGGAATCIGGRHPGSPVRPGLCLSGHAHHRLRRSPGPHERDPGGQAAPSASWPPPPPPATPPTATRSAWPPAWSTSSTTRAISPSTWSWALWVGAAPANNVVREQPAPGDVVILLGGRTGRDGIGGATGSSKSHNKKSLQTMASEVQKGNAPEERKIQRAVPGRQCDPDDQALQRLRRRRRQRGHRRAGRRALSIDLNAVRKKYEGLDGTELAISESQERMAVVVAAQGRGKSSSPPPPRRTWRPIRWPWSPRSPGWS